MDWIDVKEQMPEESTECILRQDYNDEILDGYYEDGEWWIAAEEPFIGHYRVEDSDNVDYNITHWKPKISEKQKLEEAFGNIFSFKLPPPSKKD